MTCDVGCSGGYYVIEIFMIGEDFPAWSVHLTFLCSPIGFGHFWWQLGELETTETGLGACDVAWCLSLPFAFHPSIPFSLSLSLSLYFLD